MKSLEHAMKTTGMDFIDFRFIDGIKAKIVAPVISMIVAFGAVLYGGPNSENPGGLVGNIADEIGNTVKEVFLGSNSSLSEPKNISGNTGGTKPPNISDRKSMKQFSNPLNNNTKSNKKNPKIQQSIDPMFAMQQQRRMQEAASQNKAHIANQKAPGQFM